MESFASRVAAVEPAALQASAVEVLQLNVSLRCNMACAHCHQQASPQRSEDMPEHITAAALDWARQLQPALVDLTGGAPELHPRIRAIVDGLIEAGLGVQVRSNLTVLLEDGSRDLPRRWADQGVAVLASLPSWDAAATDRQRGAGAFTASIEALQRLNAAGYGTGDGLRLDIASNPLGADLPESAAAFEQRFRDELGGRHGIAFDGLRLLTNMPLGRFQQQLGGAAEQGAYLDMLRCAFNPETVPQLACRTSLSVAPDGRLYDCDFNLGAGLACRGEPRSVLDAPAGVATRRIAFGPHCFACTARSGSS